MGNWAIIIEGTGQHHNGDMPCDADRQAKEFVDALRRAGQNVTHATFIASVAEDILPRES